MTIQKFSVPAKEFPLFFSDGSYHVRYKIVTDNKMISSDLSDVYQIFINNASIITNAIGDGSTITYTSINTFSVGDVVNITEISPSNFNISNATIVSRTSSDFTISNTYAGTYMSGGYAATITTANFILASQEITLSISPTADSAGMLIKWDTIQNSSFSNMDYDVYLKWSYNEAGLVYDTDWTYIGQYSSAEAYVTTPSTTEAYYLKARIQIATYDKVISNNVLLVESSAGVSTTYVSLTGNIDGGVV